MKTKVLYVLAWLGLYLSMAVWFPSLRTTMLVVVNEHPVSVFHGIMIAATVFLLYGIVKG